MGVRRHNNTLFMSLVYGDQIKIIFFYHQFGCQSFIQQRVHLENDRLIKCLEK